MIFQRKINRAMQKLHEEGDYAEKKMYEQPTQQEWEDIPELEKNDFLAMVIAALLTFIPMALIVLGVIVLVGYLFLFH